MTASEPIVEAQKVYLNDAAAQLYTTAALLPFLSAAYDELQQELELNGTSHLEEVSAVITVTAGAVTLTLPSDFVQPIKLEEATVGGTDWTPMTRLDWEPSVVQDTFLRVWNYREDAVKLLGSTVNRDVKLFYIKSLTPITLSSTVIPIINSKRFLALKTAALAALFIGQNPILGDRLEAKAQSALDILTGNDVRKQQGLPVRRRPYGSSRRMRTRDLWIT